MAVLFALGQVRLLIGIGALDKRRSDQQLLDRVVIHRELCQRGGAGQHLVHADTGQGGVDGPLAGLLPHMHPVLDHAGLLGIQAQAVFQSELSQVVAFLDFLQASDMVERHDAQALVPGWVGVLSGHVAGPASKGLRMFAQSLVDQPQVDQRLP